ncbi:unnamed protein product [Gadus morhua 'NCC']
MGGDQSPGGRGFGEGTPLSVRPLYRVCVSSPSPSTAHQLLGAGAGVKGPKTSPPSSQPTADGESRAFRDRGSDRRVLTPELQAGVPLLE